MRNFKILEGTKSITDKKIIQTLFSYDPSDYVVELKKVTLKGLKLAGMYMTKKIQKDLSGKRSGRLYGIYMNENSRSFIKHRASSYKEFPAVLTGRIRSSISFADSESKKVITNNQENKRFKIKNKNGVTAVYKLNKRGLKATDFIKPPKSQRNVISLKIGTNVPYARKLEFNAPQKGGRPFMRRSFNENWKNVKRMVYTTLRKGNL